ncbi:MAG: hypothetical protein ACLTT1_13430 [[Clostridium] scindens]
MRKSLPAGRHGRRANQYWKLGRFAMGPYGSLATKAIHEKHAHKEYYCGVMHARCRPCIASGHVWSLYRHIPVTWARKRIPATIVSMMLQALRPRREQLISSPMDRMASRRLTRETPGWSFHDLEAGAHGSSMDILITAN